MVGGGVSINTVSAQAQGLADPPVNLWRGVAEGRGIRGQHSCSSTTMLCFADGAERRPSAQGCSHETVRLRTKTESALIFY